MRPHSECRRQIEEGWGRVISRTVEMLGRPIEGKIIISTVPLTHPLFGEDVFTCPHGTDYWIAPDAEMQLWLMQVTPEDVRQTWER